MSEVLDRLETNTELLIESHKRKRELITKQCDSIVSLQGVVTKDQETIAAYISQVDSLKSELQSAMSNNPDLSSLVADRDKKIADLTAQSAMLRDQIAADQVIIDTANAEDNAEDEKIAKLLGEVVETLKEDDIAPTL